MTMIRFSVPCVPVSQPRQRHRIVKPADRFDDDEKDPCDRCFTANYTPSSDPVQAFKASLRLAAHAEHDGAPFEGPIRLDLLIVMPRPKAKVWKRKAMEREWYAGRSDRENILKAVQDALQELLWRNDSQIVSGETSIVIASGDEQPHVELTIETLGAVVDL
jgi:Holliday junction resolvase RusA-like endonuclease